MGVIVAVCGPVGLGDEVVKAVSKVDEGMRETIGGVDMYEELSVFLFLNDGELIECV
jgi:hypothetical protein